MSVSIDVKPHESLNVRFTAKPPAENADEEAVDPSSGITDFGA